MTTIQAFLAKIRVLWIGLPEGVQKALRDAVIAGFGAFVALNLAIPSTLDQAKAEGLIAVLAVSAAIIAVIRVELLPAIIAWLLGTTQSEMLAEKAARTLTAANKAR